MGDYHTYYKGPEGETTEWEDIQTRLGNLPPKPKPPKPDAYKPEEEAAKDAAWLDKRDEAELQEGEDDYPDDRALEEYRQRRLAELRDAAARPRFGTLEDITSNEFVARVTEASDTAWVVVLLHKPANAGCALLAECLQQLAGRYPGTAFVRIVSTAAIPGYPDANLPTLLLYHNRACVATLVGLRQFGGPRATPEQVALVLNTYGPVCGGEDEADGGGGAGAQAGLVKGLVQSLVAQRERDADDESSDFGD